MKSYIIVALTLGLAANISQAASEQILKKKAIEIRDSNAPRQTGANSGRPALGQVPAPHQTVFVTNAPAGTLSADQQRLLRLHNSITAIRVGTTMDPVIKSQLEKDLVGIVKGDKRPTSRSVSKLADGIYTALMQKPLSRPTQARLVQNLNTVLNAQSSPSVKVDEAISDTQALFESSMVPKKDAERIATELRAALADVRK